jgi:hypothetical protein
MATTIEETLGELARELARQDAELEAAQEAICELAHIPHELVRSHLRALEDVCAEVTSPPGAFAVPFAVRV